MMYVSAHGGFLFFCCCCVSSTSASSSVSDERCLATAWKASTSELAAVPPEKTQTPFLAVSAATAVSPVEAKAAADDDVCMGDDEPGDAVRPTDVARTAAGRKGVPVPSSIAVQGGDVIVKKKKMNEGQKKCENAVASQVSNQSKKAGTTTSLYIVTAVNVRWERTRSGKR